MTEINTFSAAVDDVVNRSGRPDRKIDIISFVRTSIRECQVNPSGVAKFFRNDLTEDTLISDGSSYIWTYPRRFRYLRTVRYNIVDQRGNKIYPKEKLPGKSQLLEDYYYYGGPGYFAFSGVSNGLSIDVAYYSFLKKLAYYEVANRPATFSLETDSWTYLTATSDSEKATAELLVTNWLLTDYYDLIVEGALAKVLKVIGDERSRSSYALYKELQTNLIAAEPSDSLNK